jgi:hypothetical protein
MVEEQSVMNDMLSDLLQHGGVGSPPRESFSSARSDVILNDQVPVLKSSICIP